MGKILLVFGLTLCMLLSSITSKVIRDETVPSKFLQHSARNFLEVDLQHFSEDFSRRKTTPGLRHDDPVVISPLFLFAIKIKLI